MAVAAERAWPFRSGWQGETCVRHPMNRLGPVICSKLVARIEINAPRKPFLLSSRRPLLHYLGDVDSHLETYCFRQKLDDERRT